MRPIRWFLRLKPHVKVGVVTAVLVVSGVAVLAVSLARIQSAEAPAREAARRTLPARDELAKVAQGQEAINTKFTNMLTEPDGAARIVLLEDIRRQLSQNEQSWRRFRELSVGYPGESDLIATYDRTMQHQNELAGPVGLGIINGARDQRPPGEMLADPTFTELRSTQYELQGSVHGLLDRYYDPAVTAEVNETVDAAYAGKRDVLFAFAGVMVISSVVAIASYRSARQNQREQERQEHERAEEARRNELEARLYRALEMANTEEAAYGLVRQALAEALPGRPTELLAAETSESHFRQVLVTQPGSSGCSVVAPGDCPAALRGLAMSFVSSTDLDACPYLRDRDGPACSAVCQPVSIAGKSIGVVHSTAPLGESPSEQALGDLELIARRAGDRIGMLRAFAESESQARTDPLTGLLNRRSLENAVRRLKAEGLGYVVGFGDLDRFKELNDSHGHDVGDRALRLFARAMRDSIRPNDLACRYGGEEFVVVIPDCRVDEAVGVLERVRDTLAESLDGDRVPLFTVSFGVASSRQADSFERVVSLADAALLEAKASGRDRITVSAGDRVALMPAAPPQLAPPER